MAPTEQLKQVVDNLINKMETEDSLQWMKPWKSSFPSNYSSKRNYSGFNVIVLWSVAAHFKYPTNYWMSFKQITEKGGKILKGEKATPVFFFKPLEIEEENEQGEKELKTIPVLKTFNVFNVAQTDLVIDEINETETILSAEEFISNLNIEVIQDNFAYYQPKRHLIGMPHKDTFVSSEAYYATFFHEAGHYTSKECKRDITGNKFGSDEYAKEETIAETIKCFVMSHLRLEDENTKEFEQSAAYIRGWLKKANPKDLMKIFSEAQKGFDYLLSLQNQEEEAA